MALPATKIDRPFTYGDYLTWPDDERWEIIDGVPMNMGPAPMRRHQKILGTLYFTMQSALNSQGNEKCEVYLSPFDVRLPEKDESDDEIITVVQPDLVIVCDRSKLDDRGCRGAPDVLFEILSPSSGKRDLLIKRDLYERHGVKEYWILQPESKTVMVYILTDGIYPKAQIFGEGDEFSLHILPDIGIKIDHLFEN